MIVLDASCEGGVVTSMGQPIPEAIIVSNGVGASEGQMFADKEKAIYVTSNASDIAEAIDKLVDVIDLVTNTLLAIGTNMTGPTTSPPPDIALNAVEIATKASELRALRSNLK